MLVHSKVAEVFVKIFFRFVGFFDANSERRKG